MNSLYFTSCNNNSEIRIKTESAVLPPPLPESLQLRKKMDKKNQACTHKSKAYKHNTRN